MRAPFFFLFLLASLGDPAEASVPATHICARNHSVRLCFVPLRMARARESYSDDHHSFDVSGMSFMKCIRETILLTPITITFNIQTRLLADSSPRDGRLFLLLSITGHVSLFPLLFTPFENVIKAVLVLAYSLASYSFLVALHCDPKSKSSRLQFRSWERIYLGGLVGVALFECCLYSIVDPARSLPFLPLMVMSLYTSIGVVYVWLCFVWQSFTSETKKTKQK